MALRKTNTDYLDDIGGVYPDEDLVLRYDPKDGEIILALSDRSQDNLLGVDNKQRSSSKKKDNYLQFGQPGMLQLTLLKIFGLIQTFPKQLLRAAKLTICSRGFN